jgi:hypothetical protein
LSKKDFDRALSDFTEAIKSDQVYVELRLADRRVVNAFLGER